MSTRTTLTLEDDVVERLRAASRQTGRPMKAIVNDALRAGLDPGIQARHVRFRVKPRNMGFRSDLDLDDISGLLERLEGPDHR